MSEQSHFVRIPLVIKARFEPKSLRSEKQRAASTSSLQK